VGREWAESGQRVGREWAESGQRVGREWGESGERVGREWGEWESGESGESRMHPNKSLVEVQREVNFFGF
jgi:hypothetical protein